MLTLIIVLLVVLVAVGGLIAFIFIPTKKDRAVEETPKKKVKRAPLVAPPKKAVEKAPAVKEEAETVEPEKEEVKPETGDKEEAEEETETAENEHGSDDERAVKVVEENGETRYIVIKYSKSFQAKLIQSDELTKSYYSEIKNCIMSYGGVKSRMSWRWEAFRAGRKTLVKLRLRGKTLSVALALNPADFEDTKYHVESIAEVAAYAETPCLYRIKNDRRVRYTKDLVARVMQENGLAEYPSAVQTDYASQYPYETTEALLRRKLIKELTDEDAQSGTVFKPSDIRKSVTAQEVDTIMRDEIAELLVEKLGGVSDRTKTGIVNIDTLSQYFTDGERVTLEEIKKRVAGFDRKVTYVKVLARGTLDKQLTVEADSFSLQAVKMIVLTGGKALKK